MKYYIASKLENHAAHNALRDQLNTAGHEITYDWTHHGPVYRSGLERVREVAMAEYKGVLDADFVVVLWPGGRGTHVEMGMAIGAGKPIIFISEVEAHHESTTETCAFYHHSLVCRGRISADVLPLVETFAASRFVPAPQLAKTAISHVLNAICDDPRKFYLMGWGTGSYAKLTEAHAALHGLPVEEVRNNFVPDKVPYDRHCERIEEDERLLTHCREEGIAVPQS